MQTRIVEATSTTGLYGKFLLGVYDDAENAHRSMVMVDDTRPVVHQRGFKHRAVWVCDLATEQGALFTPGGLAVADLYDHDLRVGPLFAPFLAWLYDQDDPTDLDALSDLVVFDHHGSAQGGHP